MKPDQSNTITPDLIKPKSTAPTKEKTKVQPTGKWKGKVIYSVEWNTSETNLDIENQFFDSDNKENY